jgi:spermidine synthase
MATVLLLWQPAPQRLLLIGVGGGSLPMALAAARPDLQVDAVDIDPAVLRVAQRYFGLRAGPRLRLHAADGRAYVAEALAAGRRYDAVLLDAFDADGIPPALFSEAFLRDVRALLAGGGVLLANTFATSPSSVREADAAAAVFGAYLDVRADEAGNRLIVAAGEAKRLPSAQELLARLPAQRTALASLGIDDGWVRQLRFAVEHRRPAAQPQR